MADTTLRGTIKLTAEPVDVSKATASMKQEFGKAINEAGGTHLRGLMAEVERYSPRLRQHLSSLGQGVGGMGGSLRGLLGGALGEAQSGTAGALTASAGSLISSFGIAALGGAGLATLGIVATIGFIKAIDLSSKSLLNFNFQLGGGMGAMGAVHGILDLQNKMLQVKVGGALAPSAMKLGEKEFHLKEDWQTAMIPIWKSMNKFMGQAVDVLDKMIPLLDKMIPLLVTMAAWATHQLQGLLGNKDVNNSVNWGLGEGWNQVINSAIGQQNVIAATHWKLKGGAPVGMVHPSTRLATLDPNKNTLTHGIYNQLAEMVGNVMLSAQGHGALIAGPSSLAPSHTFERMIHSPKFIHFAPPPLIRPTGAPHLIKDAITQPLPVASRAAAPGPAIKTNSLLSSHIAATHAHTAALHQVSGKHIAVLNVIAKHMMEVSKNTKDNEKYIAETNAILEKIKTAVTPEVKRYGEGFLDFIGGLAAVHPIKGHKPSPQQKWQAIVDKATAAKNKAGVQIAKLPSWMTPRTPGSGSGYVPAGPGMSSAPPEGY